MYMHIQALVSPYWSHAFQIWLLTALPEWIVIKITLDMHAGIRAAGTYIYIRIHVCE
jgi:hypothetical protein